MKVTVIKQHSYSQKRRFSGDCYEASDRDVPILRLMKLVETQPDKPAPRLKTQQDRPTPRAKKPKGKKHRYKRRDMKAGD